MKHLQLFEGTWKAIQDKKFAKRDLIDNIEDNLIDNLADCLFTIFDKFNISEKVSEFNDARPTIHWWHTGPHNKNAAGCRTSQYDGCIRISHVKGQKLKDEIKKSISEIKSLIEKRIFHNINIVEKISYIIDDEDSPQHTAAVYDIDIIPGKNRILEEYS